MAAVWIKGPWTDLVFFSLGWLPLLGAFLWVDRPRWTVLFLGVLLFNFLHRHLTFPMVYGDPAVFRRRRLAYILVPVVSVGLTALSLLPVKPAELRTAPLAAPLRLPAGAFQEFVCAREGALVTLPVRFTGRERTLDDAAAAFTQGLAGRFVVEAADGALRFRADPGHVGEFYLGRWWGAADQPRQLGLEGIGNRWVSASRPYFEMLIVVGVLWTIFHTIMQKVGILRIYSRKAGVQGAWLDRALVWSWFAALVVFLGGRPEVRAQAKQASVAGRAVVGLFEAAPALLPVLLGLALLVAAAVTILYARQELRAGFAWPKNLFALSVLGLYAAFVYDLVAGYAIFAFSHAIEYLAFVNVFARRKYLGQPPESSFLARAIRRHALSMAAFVVIAGGVFLGWRHVSEATLTWYIVGTGFLHLLYDGWIWKVRAPEVGRPLGV